MAMCIFLALEKYNGWLGLAFIVLVYAWVFREWFRRLWALVRREEYIPRAERTNSLKRNPLGDSHFVTARASQHAIRLNKINEANGLVYGAQDNYLVYRDSRKEGHTLVIGGSGEGKSACHVIPTLLTWQGSAVVIDIKGELYNKTAAYRRTINRVLRFNPVGSDASYNPIDQCKTVFQAQDLAATLIPEPKEGDPFWAQSAQGIFAAAVLEGNRFGLSLSDVCARCIETPIVELVGELSESEYREVRLLAGGFVDLPEKALGGVAGEMRSKLLTLATDEDVIRATQKSDFTAADMEHPTTIYLTVPESRLEQLRPLWTSIIQQLIRHMQDRPEDAPVPILMMLDEFPRLGKLPQFDASLATLRSRNVHFSIIIQSLAQLDDRYSEDIRRIIVDNCPYKLILSASDDKTQKALSDLAGQRAVEVTSSSKTYGGGDVVTAVMGQSGYNWQEQTVPLIRPEEFGRLGEAAILFQPRNMPMRINRLWWFKNQALQLKAQA